MRICFVCNEYPPGPHGGLGTFTRVMGRALAEAGHEVRVIGWYPAGFGGASYEVDKGVRVWRFNEPGHRFGWISARHRVFRQVQRWARDREIDVVEVADWVGAAAGWPQLPVPVVARLNGSQTFFASELGKQVSRSAFLIERASLRRASSWCSASAYTGRESRRLFGLKSGPDAVLYNPVELPELPAQPPPRSATRVVFTGTLTPKKGVISLARAWKQVNQEAPEAELHLYGKDGVTEEGKSMTHHLVQLLGPEAARRVTFHGHVGREILFDALHTARAAVFPSYAEAFGIAPFEAMARCCPTIYTTRQPGPELVRDGQDGLLVDPDRPDDIAAALIRLLRDDDLALRLGSAGRELVRSRYAVSALLPQNEEFFRQAIVRFRMPAMTLGSAGARRDWIHDGVA